MPQFLSLCVVVAVAVVLNLKAAAMMTSDGNWGGAIGAMLFGPVVFFLVFQAVLFYGTRLVRGPAAVTTFTTSRLNYVSGLIALLGVLGAAANPM